MQYHAIPCSTMQYRAIPCNTMQYHAIPCNTMQYHAPLIAADGAYHCPVGHFLVQTRPSKQCKFCIYLCDIPLSSQSGQAGHVLCGHFIIKTSWHIKMRRNQPLLLSDYQKGKEKGKLREDFSRKMFMRVLSLKCQNLPRLLRGTVWPLVQTDLGSSNNCLI